MNGPRRLLLLPAAALLLLAPVARGQESGSGEKPAEGTSTEPAAPKPGGVLPGGPPKSNPPTVPGPREEIWRPPTEEDWKRPVLLKFQRTWEDAVAVARETKRPILVCVNMDGEIASEHWAGVRYRMRETAEMCEPYVCVIASVYRHTPKDFDDAGRRILCPRLGSVTCGEHIALEPVVYEKFLDGRRISPRHIMVEPDGREIFDVFYANDVASVGRTLVDGIAERPGGSPTVVRGDRPVVQRVASRDATDRDAVEAAYAKGEEPLRRDLLEAAAAHPETAPLDLLRLAIFGVDGEMAALARKALAKSTAPEAAGLIADALRSPLEPAEREALLAALDRLASGNERARWLAVVHRGLSGPSSALDAGAWAGATYPAAPEGPAPDRHGDSVPEASQKEPEDGPGLLDLAEAFLQRALDARSGAGGPEAFGGGMSGKVTAGLLFEDARRLARRAAEKGAGGWRSDAVIAVASYWRGDRDEAYARSEGAVKGLPPGDGSRVAASVLVIFGEARWMAIKAAVRAKEKWPAAWLADLNAAYAILRRHPLGTPEQVLWHLDLLQWLGAKTQAGTVLDDGLARFPASGALQSRARTRILEEKGPEGLLAHFDARLKERPSPAGIHAQAARGAVEAAEAFRRARKSDPADAAYEKALDLLARAAKEEPARRAEFDRAAALVHAGRARLALARNDDARAFDAILASFKAMPEAAGDKDGLGFAPVETAQALLARLVERKQESHAARIRRALSELDPDFLRPDR